MLKIQRLLILLPYSQLNDGRLNSMYTCCPHCQTCFRITKAQLDVAQGKVRCGHCKQIFNGKQRLRDELPGQQDKPAVSDSSPPPVTPKPASATSEEPRAKAADLDFDLFDLSTIPASHPEDEAWLNDTEEGTDHLDSDAWLEEETFDDEEDDVTANLDEPYEEFDELYEVSDEEQEEEDFSADLEAEIKAEPERETPESPSPSRYAYVDPEDQVGEQQDIEKFIEEMNSQLAEVVDQPIDIQAFESDVDMDLAATPAQDTEQATPAREIAPEPPVTSTTDDEFKQAFLDNLDSTLALQPTPLKPAESSPAKPQSEPEPASSSQPANVPPPATREPETVRRQDKSVAIPLRLRDSLAVKSEPRRPLWLALGLLGILAFSAALLVQLAFFRSSQLLDRFPGLQPYVERICTTLPCRYSGPRDVSQIKLLNRDIRIHPKVNNALLISATFINRAPFKQPYPDITISLSDLSGALVAQRRFTPAEYLGRLNSPFLLMPSSKPVQIALEVVDPGKDAVNFEFTFQ